jgi:phage tail protein X
MFDELRTNARLRLGIAAAVALVAVSLLLDARAALRAKAAAVAREQARVAGIAARSNDTVWMERAQAARALRDDLESRLWHAASAGAAEAAFVDWMNRQLLDAKATVTNVVSAVAPGAAAPGAAPTGPVLPEGTMLLRLNVAFAFAPGTLERVLDRILAGDRYTVVESVVVKQRPVPRVELIVSSVARVSAPAGERKP